MHNFRVKTLALVMPAILAPGVALVLTNSARAEASCPAVHPPAPAGVSDIRAALNETRRSQAEAASASTAAPGGRAVTSFDPPRSVSSIDALRLSDGTLPTRIFLGIPTAQDGFYTVQVTQADAVKLGLAASLKDALQLTIQDLLATGQKHLDPALDLIRISAAADLKSAVDTATRGVSVYAASYDGILSGGEQKDADITTIYEPANCPFVDPIVPSAAVESWGVMQDAARKAPSGNPERAQLLSPVDTSTGDSQVVSQQ